MRQWLKICVDESKKMREEGRQGKKRGRKTGNRDGRKEAGDAGRKGRGRVSLSPQGGF